MKGAAADAAAGWLFGVVALAIAGSDGAVVVVKREDCGHALAVLRRVGLEQIQGVSQGAGVLEVVEFDIARSVETVQEVYEGLSVKVGCCVGFWHCFSMGKRVGWSLGVL